MPLRPKLFPSRGPLSLWRSTAVAGTSSGCTSEPSTGGGWLDSVVADNVSLAGGDDGVLRRLPALVSGGGDLINCGSAVDGDGDTTPEG